MDLKTVLREVESLSIVDRVQLVQEVCDQLTLEGHASELDPEMKAQIDRRLEAHRRNPGVAIPWKTVEAEALERLPR